MQAELSQQLERGQANRSTVTTLNTGGRSRWIPAEVWQRQGMSAQEMTLPLGTYRQIYVKSKVMLKLVVCILLRVLGEVQGFRLTQHWFEYFIQ
jgi:hypothetical protein